MRADIGPKGQVRIIGEKEVPLTNEEAIAELMDWCEKLRIGHNELNHYVERMSKPTVTVTHDPLHGIDLDKLRKKFPAK